MPKYNFNLRSQVADRPVPVNFIIRWSNRRLVYPTGESILPVYWCAEKKQRNYQRAKETKAFPEYSDFNERLDKLLASAKSAFSQFARDFDREPEEAELKQALDKATGKTKGKPTDLLGYIDTFNAQAVGKVNAKTGKPLHSTYHGRNKLTAELLREYLAERRKGSRIPFSALDADFVEGFMKFLTTGKGLATNTVGKYMRALRMFVTAAEEEGYEVNRGFRSKRITIPEERTDKVYLNEAELEAMQRLDLSRSPRLDKARDLFLIGAWTGLRFGDVSILREAHVGERYIRLQMSKTGKSVVIPVLPQFLEVVAKNGGQVPPVISNQKLNDYVKEVARLVPALHAKVMVGITKGGVRREVAHAKWELISTHTARRSFATNLYQRGIASQTIMSVTGHRTEAAFLKYLRLDGEQHADIIAAAFNGQQHLKAVV
jgi:integrase